MNTKTTILKRTCEHCDNCKYTNKDKNANLATFRFRKTIVDGKPQYNLLDWHNVQNLEDLPNEYFDHYPYFWQDTKGNYIFLFESLSLDITAKPGRKTLSQDDFSYFVEQAKIAGERLTKINRRLRQPKDVEFEITI